MTRWRAEGAAVWNVENLAYLYRRTLESWIGWAEPWPASEDFLAVIAEIHEHRRAQGWPEERFAQQDYEVSLLFELKNRVADSRAHLSRILESYTRGNPYRLQILSVLASYARLCLDFERTQELLEQADAEVPLCEESGVRFDAEVHLAIQWASLQVAVGMQDLAPATLEKARAIVTGRATELGALYPYARSNLLLQEMIVANALEDYQYALDLWGAAQTEDWYATVDPAQKLEHDLRRCDALATMERLDPDAPREAEEALLFFLEEPNLRSDERWLALSFLIEAEIRSGKLHEAREQLRAYRTELANTESYCAVDLPRKREIDAIALGAHLEALLTTDPAALATVVAETRGALESMVERWRQAPTRDGGLAVTQTRDRLQVAEAYVDVLLRHKGDEAGCVEAVEAIAQMQSAGSLARELGAEACDLQAIQQFLLPSNGGLLLYLPGNWNSYAFAIDHDQISVHRLAPRQEYERSQKGLLLELARAVREDRRTPALDALLQRLATFLLPVPLAERIAGWQELVIVGMEGIGYLPFELLAPTPDRTLGQTAAISYLPSLPVGVWLAREHSSPAPLEAGRGSIHIIAAGDAPGLSQESYGLTNLSFSAREEELLLRPSQLTQVVLRTGAAAQAEAVLNPELQHALAVQIIAHTVESGRWDRPRALLLAPAPNGKNVLSPNELEQAHLPPLVFLTACGAAQGPLRRGDDGRNHLGGALFLAGAQTAVLSALDVEYHGALELVGQCYRSLLQEGASPAVAMLRARQAARPDALLPYLMHVHGPAHRPYLPATPAAAGKPTGRQLYWFCGGLALLLATLGWILRSRARAGTPRPGPA